MSLGWSSEVQWPVLLHVENVNVVYHVRCPEACIRQLYVSDGTDQ